MPLNEYIAIDCWAYGKLLSAIAKKLSTSSLAKKLQLISNDLIKADLKACISLSNTLERI
jgi:hypothetical protein